MVLATIHHKSRLNKIYYVFKMPPRKIHITLKHYLNPELRLRPFFMILCVFLFFDIALFMRLWIVEVVLMVEVVFIVEIGFMFKGLMVIGFLWSKLKAPLVSKKKICLWINWIYTVSRICHIWNPTGAEDSGWRSTTM